MKENYQFKAWYYDEDNGEKFAQGYVSASCYVEAMQDVVQYFGNNELFKVELKWVSDKSVLFIPHDMSIDKITKENI